MIKSRGSESGLSRYKGGVKAERAQEDNPMPTDTNRRGGNVQERVGHIETRLDHFERAVEEQARENREFRTVVNDSLAKILTGQTSSQNQFDERVTAKIEKAVNLVQQTLLHDLAETRGLLEKSIATFQTSYARDLAEVKSGVAENRTNIDNVRTTQLTSGKVNWSLIIAGIGLFLTLVATIVGAGAWATTALTDKSLVEPRNAIATLKQDVDTIKTMSGRFISQTDHEILRGIVDKKADGNALEAVRVDLDYLKKRDTQVASENSKSVTDREDMHNRLGRDEERTADEIKAILAEQGSNKGDRLAYQQKNEADKKEIETQFKDLTHVINTDKVWNTRMLSMLWEKTFSGVRFPNDTQYYPEHFKENDGAPMVHQ